MWKRTQPTVAGHPKVATTFTLGAGPMTDVASDQTTHKAYVTSSGDDSLYVADTKSRTSSIKVGESPGFVAVDPTTQTAYVTSGNSVSVVDISTGSITGAIGVGKGPDGIEVDTSTHTIYVANADDSSVSVIDARTRRVTATIKVGNSPDKMGVDPTGHLLYVANKGSDSVAVIDPAKATVIQTIPVGRSPGDVAIDAPTRTAFVPNAGDGSVSVLDLEKRSVVGTVKVGDAPSGDGRLRCAHRLRHQLWQRFGVRDRLSETRCERYRPGSRRPADRRSGSVDAHRLGRQLQGQLDLRHCALNDRWGHLRPDHGRPHGGLRPSAVIQ
jgi:YVTN family beta-propeller protein